jgi:hypothetical protein
MATLCFRGYLSRKTVNRNLFKLYSTYLEMITMEIIEDHENKRWIFPKTDEFGIGQTAWSSKMADKSLRTFNQTSWCCIGNSMVISMNVEVQDCVSKTSIIYSPTATVNVHCNLSRTLVMRRESLPQKSLTKVCSVIVSSQTRLVLTFFFCHLNSSWLLNFDLT